MAGLEDASLGALLKAVTVVGGGWAGLAAAVRASQLGFRVRLLEAAPQLGGRARRVVHQGLALDNGQHILIGAYRQTLDLLHSLGLDEAHAFHRTPLNLQSLDGAGLRLPDLPSPWHLLAGVAMAKGWSWRDKLALVRQSLAWQRAGFACAPLASVAQVCTLLTPRVMQDLIEPLCVSALNIDSTEASAEVFLRVLSDALFAGAGSSDLLLPRHDLGQLLPDAAERWLLAQGADIVTHHLVSSLPSDTPVLLACPAWQAAELTHRLAPAWSAQASALAHTAIATVYLHTPEPLIWPSPMLALPTGPGAVAQFAFDKGRLSGQAQWRGVLAMVVSHCSLNRDDTTQAALWQAHAQLGLKQLTHLTTVVEKRATFACTPGLVRPGTVVTEGVWACGDYVAGPYPATLEGAVRSGIQAAESMAGQHMGENTA